jgi:hypothetical protein
MLLASEAIRAIGISLGASAAATIDGGEKRPGGEGRRPSLIADDKKPLKRPQRRRLEVTGDNCHGFAGGEKSGDQIQYGCLVIARRRFKSADANSTVKVLRKNLDELQGVAHCVTGSTVVLEPLEDCDCMRRSLARVAEWRIAAQDGDDDDFSSSVVQQIVGLDNLVKA